MTRPPNPVPDPPTPPRKRRWLRGCLVLLVLLPGVLALAVRLRYGGGAAYPDLSGPPLLAESLLVQVVSSPEPIGNLAVSASGRLFYTLHPEGRPPGPKLWEWVAGEARPFPDAQRQEKLFETPLGLAIDGQNRLWSIDHGSNGFGSARLLAFDLESGEVVHDFRFGALAPWGSFLQDLQVDAAGQTVYIADVSFWRKSPALLVYDVGQKSARRVLEGHASVSPQDWIIRPPAGEMVFFGGLAAMKPGVDGLALSRDGAWLYYGAMTHDTLFRVPTAALRDTTLSAEQLAGHVEEVGAKPLCDGLSTDLQGNVLLTDVEHGAVLRMAPDGTLQTLVKSARIRWADALSYGPDGWLYLADSAIPELVLQSRAHVTSQAPYFIYRFKPGIAGVPGQ